MTDNNRIPLLQFTRLPDLVSKVTTNTATIWSFSSHWSLTERPGKGTWRSVPRVCGRSHPCPQSTVRGRPGLPSPLAITAVRLFVGLQVMAVVVVPLLHPVTAAVPVGVRRPTGCELFSGGTSSSRGGAGGGGAAWFGSGGGISSQSSSGARSDCFTMVLRLPPGTREGRRISLRSAVQLNRAH